MTLEFGVLIPSTNFLTRALAVAELLTFEERGWIFSKHLRHLHLEGSWI
jgi:hypothetical protein